MCGLSNQATRYLSIPELYNLELVRGSKVTHFFPRHFHEGYTICIIESGYRVCQHKRNSHLIPAGSIMLVNPGEVHSCGSGDAGCSYRVICPDTRLVTSAVSQDGKLLTPYFKDLVLRDEDISKRLLNLFAALEEPGFKLEQETFLLDILIQLFSRDGGQNIIGGHSDREPARIRQVREYLEENYAYNVSIEELSLISGVSSYHLIRIFRREVGLPPHLYQTRIRIKKAKNLLEQGVSIADVAAITGFVDQAHFTRCFKKHMAITPGNYALAKKAIRTVQN